MISSYILLHCNVSCVELKKTIESMKAEHTKERDNQHQVMNLCFF